MRFSSSLCALTSKIYHLFQKKKTLNLTVLARWKGNFKVCANKYANNCIFNSISKKKGKLHISIGMTVRRRGKVMSVFWLKRMHLKATAGWISHRNSIKMYLQRLHTSKINISEPKKSRKTLFCESGGTSQRACCSLFRGTDAAVAAK